MGYTLTETGKVLTETQEGVTLPAGYSSQQIPLFIKGEITMMQAFYINRAVALAYKPIIALLEMQRKLLEGVYAS